MRKTAAAVFMFSCVAGTAQAETAYERVQRTGVIRCGYIETPGYFEKNAQTGKISGMAYDAAESMGRELGLRIEWTESVGWATYQQSLDAGRTDVTCAGLWEAGKRARVSILTNPLFYTGMYVAVRKDDMRFDASLNTLDDPSVVMETLDADVTESVKEILFSKAKDAPERIGLTNKDYLMNIATGKVDAGFFGVQDVKAFNAQNPDTQLKLAAGGKAVRMSGNVFAVKSGEVELKMMLDSAINVLITSRRIERLTRKHEGFTAPVAQHQ